ncbi:MAG: pyruvate ferredoxin oxidoreductase [Dehalococcoidia bacterium]|nr:pyruvate ferredoxin oxidoreductase [Dehalococcoidia bacterium]
MVSQKVKSKPVALDGDRAVAEAIRQMNPDVVAAYPITPQTEIVMRFSEFVANGEVDTEFIPVESEHAAMSACIGASAAGGRAQTATAGAGLAFMWEVLWVASGTRLPIVMHVVNRSLSAPLNIHCDHSDSMGARDAGWIQLYDETVQEAYDNAIQALRIAEHPDVMLPTLHALDGFILGHGVERVELLPDDAVRSFIGIYEPQHPLLDVDHPVTYGPMVLTDYFFEYKRQQAAAMERALQIIPQIGEEYGMFTGRYYGLMEGYRLEDAEFATVALGSTAGTTKTVVDELRDQGVKAGLLKLRCFRPFPATTVAEALGDKKAIAVLDRSLSFGAQGGPLFLEVITALFTHGLSPKVLNYAYGLGGRDIVPAQIHQVYKDLIDIDREGLTESSIRYLGLRE